MRTPKSTGRAIGALLLIQLATLTPAFILLIPMTTPAFLENAAGMALQIRIAVLLLFAKRWTMCRTSRCSRGTVPVSRRVSSTTRGTARWR